MVKSSSISTRSSRLRAAARAALFCCAAGSLAGCSNLQPGNDADSLYRMAKLAWTGNDQKVTLAEAAAVPYASMGVRIGDGPQTMIVLAGDSGTGHLWTSAAHIALMTRKGRIVRTAGLPHNLSGYEAVRSSISPNGGRTVQVLMDFADLGLYSVDVVCHDRDVGPATITILGKAIHTNRIDESCRSKSDNLDWSFQNVYWRDPDTGLTWRSVQHVHPGAAPIETEILRPPAYSAAG